MSTKEKCARCGGAGLEPDETKIGGKNRVKRQAAGLKLEEVADRMRITKGQLSALENGRRHWKPDTIERFDRAIKALTGK